MSAEKATGAITGITNFLFLAFILPGIIYLCFVLILFPFESLKALLPELEMGIDVAVGAIIFLGLTITSIIFAVDLVFRLVWSKLSFSAHKQNFAAYSEKIFNADREKELGWYFWQLWGQSIMHQNIAWGILLIYGIYKITNSEAWPLSLWFSSGKDFTIVVIVANFVCWMMFSHWHKTLMSKLSGSESGVAPFYRFGGKVCAVTAGSQVGLGGVTVRLLDSTGSEQKSVVSDNNGMFDIACAPGTISRNGVRLEFSKTGYEIVSTALEPSQELSVIKVELSRAEIVSVEIQASLTKK